MREVDTERPIWSYKGVTGPDRWSSLSDSFKPCDNGLRQSPIDITGYERATETHIEFLYDSEPIGVYNNGRTITVWYHPDSYIVTSTGIFELVQAHYHAPSEHLIDNRRYSAEIHIVHENSESDLAVVALMVEVGDANTLVDGLITTSESKRFPYGTHPVLHSRFLKPRANGYFHYIGSTTTPPCIEPVDWFIMEGSLTVSSDQLAALTSATRGPNNRAIQPLNGRTIRHVT